MDTWKSWTVRIGDRLHGIPEGMGEGCLLALWPDLSLSFALNCPGMSVDEDASFCRGVSRYCYQGLTVGVPVALWRVEFGSVAYDAAFDARPMAEGGMEGLLARYLGTPVAVLNVFVTDDWRVTHIMELRLHDDAAGRFKATLRAQLEREYTRAEFAEAVGWIAQHYTIEKIASGWHTYAVARFSLGRILATDGAIGAASEQRIRECLQLHARGDWGILAPEDVAANERALSGYGRVLSAYPIDPGLPSIGHGLNTLWIITKADRSVTTVLLPSEY